LFSAKGYLEISDTRFSLLTAQAIVARGQLDVPAKFAYTLKSPDGRSYSKYGIGLPIYYIPLVAAGNALSRLTGLPAWEVTGFLISLANIPFAILTLIAFAKLLRLFGVTEVWVSLLLLGLGLGTLTWRYAGYDFSEAMQMGLLLRRDTEDHQGPHRWGIGVRLAFPGQARVCCISSRFCCLPAYAARRVAESNSEHRLVRIPLCFRLRP
jgi:hypothetical protein